MPDDLASHRLHTLVRKRQSPSAREFEPICLFLGAGADIASGGLTFAEFKFAFYTRILGEPLESLPDSDVDEAFQNAFRDRVPPKERGQIISDLFTLSGAYEPSDEYLTLALLLQAKGIDAIITTNFDCMLERAAEMIGCTSLDIIAPGITKPYYELNSGIRLPRIPYIKLHGDIASGKITGLTQPEIASGRFEASTAKLARWIASSHTVVFAGYSGSDLGVANLIGPSIARSRKSVYWCNPESPPSDIPFARHVSVERFVHIRSNFARAIELLSRPLLEKPIQLAPRIGIIRSVLAWKVIHAGQVFLDYLEGKNAQKVLEVSVRRNEAEHDLRQFLASSKNLLVISGASGYGKTYFVASQVLRGNPDKTTSWAVPIQSRSLDTEDIEIALAKCLGLHENGIALSTLETWLWQSGIRLTVYIDGINEFSSDFHSCLMLFRSIVRASYALRERSPLKFVVTSRHETWNQLRSASDSAQLRSAIWSGDSPYSLNPVALNRFNADELRRVVGNLRELGKTSLRIQEIRERNFEQLRDPYMLRVVLEQNDFSVDGTLVLFLEKYTQLKLQGVTSGDSQIAFDALIEFTVAAINDVGFSASRGDLLAFCAGSTAALGILMDSGLLIPNPRIANRYLFQHDRIFQFFIFKAIDHHPSLGAISTVEELRSSIATHQQNPDYIAALRLWLSSSEKGLRLIEKGQRLCPSSGQDFEWIFEFTKEALLDAAIEIPTLVQDYCYAVVSGYENGAVDEDQFRAAVQVSNLLPPSIAIDLLDRAFRGPVSTVSQEVSILLLDQISDRILTGVSAETAPIPEPFVQPVTGGWQEGLKLLGIMSQIGPDNCPTTQYPAISAEIAAALGPLGSQEIRRHIKDNATSVLDTLLKGLDRYAFNGKKEDFETLFQGSGREVLRGLLDRVHAGHIVDRSDFERLRPLFQSLDTHIEFFLANLICALSARQGFKQAQRSWLEWIDEFTESTHPVEIDFYFNFSAYLFIINGQPYDGSLDKYFERFFSSWRHALTFNAGVARGIDRGLDDPVEIMFEDGFNPMAPYVFLQRSPDSQSESFERLHQMSMSLMQEGRPDLVIRLVHCVGQAIAFWPEKALSSLRFFSGIQDPLVKRYTLRTFREAYCRRPRETTRTLDTCIHTLSSSEIQSIRSSRDTRLAHRQLETVEWARMIHFLLDHFEEGRDLVFHTIRTLLTSHSLEEAINGLVRASPHDISDA